MSTTIWTNAAPPAGPVHLIGYFDPERNVFVVVSNENVWVYRHKTLKSDPTDTAPSGGS